jgi:general stress protein YciG
MPPDHGPAVQQATADTAVTPEDEENDMAEQRHTGNPGNFAENRERASQAGQIGGQHSSGNFANDPARAAEAGRKGGQNSHGGGGATHNPGNFAQNREKAVEAGRKGGQQGRSGARS